MGAYKDKNGTWYAQFRFTNWKGEADRKTKRGFATKKEALKWEREFLTQSAGNLEMTFEAFSRSTNAAVIKIYGYIIA